MSIGYVRNCGKFSAPVLLRAANAAVAAAPGPGGPAAEDGNAAEGPAALQRHRLLDAGFRLKSKAFMLTFHSRDFTDKTWPPFHAWVLERCAALGARRWAACLEESLAAAPAMGSAGSVTDKVYHLHAYRVVIVFAPLS